MSKRNDPPTENQTKYYLDDANKCRAALMAAITDFGKLPSDWSNIEKQQKLNRLQEKYFLSAERLHLHIEGVQKLKTQTES